MAQTKQLRLNIRFKTQKDMETVRRASRIKDVNLNKFAADHVVKAAREIIAAVKSEQQESSPA